MAEISICIPNYNRSKLLKNCLNSIYVSKLKSDLDFEICISDNASSENVKEIITEYKNKMEIKLNINEKNIGGAANILKVVSMAKGKFVWLIGSDDLLLPESLTKISKLFKIDKNIDFFFVNTYEVQSNILLDENKNIKIKGVPDEATKRANLNTSKKLPFFELIDPKISWDFLLGMYLSIFKREKWQNKIDTIDKEKLYRKEIFSTFENTCPHIKVFAKAFSNSKAYFEKDPLTISLIGEREWSSLYNFVEIVRIPEVLDCYKGQGLPFNQYFFCKNFSLRNYFSYL